MSDTWPLTRKAALRFREIWRASDEATLFHFALWGAGLGIMGFAIIIEFGWTGALFCIGAIIRTAGLGIEDPQS